MSGPCEVGLVIESRLENVALVAVAVRRLAEHLGLPSADAAAVELSVAEAVSNSVRHAYSGEPHHSVTVVVARTGGVLSVKVLDSGEPMPPGLEAPGCPEPDPERPQAIPEGGRGLYLMHSLMDEVTYDTLGTLNVVELKKRLPELSKPDRAV